jgi:hypothetical protein
VAEGRIHAPARTAHGTSSADPAEVFVATVKDWQPKNLRIGILIDRCDTLGLFDKFIEADHQANRLQRIHKWTVRLAVLPSAAALVLGIWQLWDEHVLGGPPGTLWLETGLIGISVASVVQGVLLDWHKRWLLLRYQAERLRLLIFQMAIDPALWKDEEPRHGDWPHWLKPRVAMIEALDVNLLAGEAEHDALMRLPAPSACRSIPAASLTALIDFYSTTWLDSQLRYFGEKVKDEEGRWWDRPSLVNVAFALSVGLVVIHLAFDIAGKGSWGRFFLMLSAIAPAAFTAFRSLRSALETSRNAARAAARLATLARHSEILHGEDHEEKPAPEDRNWFLFTTLSLSEALLESEQREWLRLMLEAEWIG